MRISTLTSITINSKKHNNTNKTIYGSQNHEFSNFKKNIPHSPLFLGKVNLAKISDKKSLTKSIQALFPENQLPKSSLTKFVWEIANPKNDKSPNYNLKLNSQSYKIFSDLVNGYEGSLDLNKDSKITGMKNKDLLMSFVRVSQEKGTSDFYIDLSKNNKPLFKRIIILLGALEAQCGDHLALTLKKKKTEL